MIHRDCQFVSLLSKGLACFSVVHQVGGRGRRQAASGLYDQVLTRPTGRAAAAENVWGHDDEDLAEASDAEVSN